jgi:predicted outer membrane protein
VVELVCADARLGTAPSSRLMGDAGPSCKGAFVVRSDEEISAILTAVDDGLTHEGTLGEADATAPTVKDLARLVLSSHARAGEANKAMLRRRHMKAEADPVSRALAKGFEDNANELRNVKGAAFDRELVNRTILQHARAVELYDALAPQAKSDDLRCDVEKDRDVALLHLALACQTLADLPPAQAHRVPRPTRPRAEPAIAPPPSEPKPATATPAPSVAPMAPAPAASAPADPPPTPAPTTEPAPSPAPMAEPAPSPAPMAEPASSAPATTEPEATPPAPCEPCP